MRGMHIPEGQSAERLHAATVAAGGGSSGASAAIRPHAEIATAIVDDATALPQKRIV